MPVTAKEVEEVASELGARFGEFKSANDKTLDGIKSEQLKLNGTLESINEKLNSLESLKSSLEDEIANSNRPSGLKSKGDDAEYKKLFLDDFVRKGINDVISKKSVNTGADSDGGYAVPEVLDKTIIELLRNQNVMRQECDVLTVGTPDYKKLVSIGGASSGWVGETDARPETNAPKLAELSTVWGELYANPQATQRSLDDVFFNVEKWIAEEVTQEFAEQEEAAFTNGDGSKKPKGLFTVPTAVSPSSFGTFKHILAASMTDVTSDELLSLIYGTKKKYRNGAKFMMNNNLLFAVRKLKDSEGNYLWAPGLQLGQPSTLLGYGIAENEQVADSAKNAMPIAFGNFKRAYKIIDRMGTRMIRDPFTNKPYIGFYTTKRVGSMIADSNAVTFLKMAAA